MGGGDGSSSPVNLSIGQKITGKVTATNPLKTQAYSFASPEISDTINRTEISITSSDCPPPAGNGNESYILEPNQTCSTSYEFIPSSFAKYSILESVSYSDKDWVDSDKTAPGAINEAEAVLAGKFIVNIKETIINVSPDGKGTPLDDVEYAYPADNRTIGKAIKNVAPGEYYFTLETGGIETGTSIEFKPINNGSVILCSGETINACNVNDVNFEYKITIPSGGCCLHVAMKLKEHSFYPLVFYPFHSYLVPTTSYNQDTKIQRLKFFIK